MFKRAFSFQRLTAGIESRTKLVKKFEKLNTREYIRSLSLLPKVWYYLYTHKKKNIFFGSLAGLAFYYDLHMKIYRWFTVVTPLQRVRNSIMRKKVNPNARLCVEPESTLKPEVREKLIDFFLRVDRELEYGLPRGVLVDIAEELKWVADRDKFIGSFLWDSGYRKDAKMREASMRLDQFLTFFEKMKEKSQQDEEVLFAAFIDKVEGKLQPARERGKKKRADKVAKEEEKKAKAKVAFAAIAPPARPELEKVEIECENIYAQFCQLMDKPSKTMFDIARLQALEQGFIQREAYRSQVYIPK